MPKIKNPFKNITFDTAPIKGKKGYVPTFDFSSRDDLLDHLSKSIAIREKQNLKNHTISAAKAKVKQIKAGTKVRKIFNTDVHSMATKTSLRNQTEIGIFTADQNLKLLKKLQKYAKADKSSPFDIDKFNEFAKQTHEGYQNKITQLALKKEVEILNRKKIKKGESAEILDRIENASKTYIQHEIQMKEYNKAHPKPKSNFTKLMDFVTEPLLPASKSEQIVKSIRKNSDIAPSDKPNPGSATGKSKGKTTEMSL